MSISEPAKITTPWASTGSKNPIPENANNTTGAAGFDKGFPDITMTPEEVGGLPPAGQDFNGIFFQITDVIRYMQAGGQPTFSSALSTAIGGYPKGAMVIGSDGLKMWQSKVDSNFTNPDTDPSNWRLFDIDLKADLASPGGPIDFSRNGLRDISTTSDFGDISLASTKYLLSDKYTSLSAAKVDFPFATSLSDSYGWAILQKQFNAMNASSAYQHLVNGTIYVNRTLVFNGRRPTSWALNLVLDGGTGSMYAIEFDVIDDGYHKGRIELNCYTSDSYSSYNWSLRSWHHGLLFKRAVGADFDGVGISGRLAGRLVTVDGVGFNGNYLKLGQLSGTCGARIGDLTRTITGRVNAGTENSPSQTTVLTLSQAVPFNVASSTVKIGSDWHVVVSNSGDTITVSPWVTDTATVANIVYGGILSTSGDNANSLMVRQVRGYESANVLAFETLMGICVGDFGAESCSTGLQIGLQPTSQMTGANQFQLWYTELNDLDIINVQTGMASQVSIDKEVGLIGNGWTTNKRKLAAKNSAGVPLNIFSSLNLKIDGRYVNPLVDPINGINSYSQEYVYFGQQQSIVSCDDTVTFTLNYQEKWRGFGYIFTEILHCGSLPNGGVYQTNIACEAPYTIEGASEVSGRVKYFPRSSRPRLLHIRLDGNVFKIREINSDGPNDPVADGAPDFRTGSYFFNASTANKGTNASISGVIKSTAINNDVFSTATVEESYSIVANKPEKKIRVKSGSTITNWENIPVEGLTTMVALSGGASLGDVITAFNALIADMKAKKYMK